jgi:drug/metabolite transporter (DMT)-like permease
MYVADVTAIGFTRPLFVTFLAVWFLSETVGWRRWVATGVGFVGVFIMVGPTAADVNYAAAGAALLGTLMFGVAMVMVRRFAPTEPPIRFVFYYHLGGVVLSLGPAIYFWQTPSWIEFGFIVAIAATSTVAMTFGIRAYSVAEVSIVGPVEYVRLLFAATLGYVVFAETPGLNTWIGAAVIIAATFYIARYEAVKRAAS